VLQLDPGTVQSRSDFVAFVRALSEQDEATWENPRTGAFLESLAAWVEDWPTELDERWSSFATALLAATRYE
jgi:hypothetical protein